MAEGGSTVVTDNVTFDWTRVEDYFDHSLSYTLSYQNHSEGVWNEIATRTSEGEYTFDVTELPDGTKILFKVVVEDEIGFYVESVSGIVEVSNPIVTSSTTTTSSTNSSTTTTSSITTSSTSSTSSSSDEPVSSTPTVPAPVIFSYISFLFLAVLLRRNLNSKRSKNY